MPYLSRPWLYSPEERERTSVQGAAPGASGAAAPGLAPAAAAEPQGTGFVNLSRYLDANAGAGAKMVEGLQGRLASTAQAAAQERSAYGQQLSDYEAKKAAQDAQVKSAEEGQEWLRTHAGKGGQQGPDFQARAKAALQKRWYWPMAAGWDLAEPSFGPAMRGVGNIFGNGGGPMGNFLDYEILGGDRASLIAAKNAAGQNTPEIGAPPVWSPSGTVTRANQQAALAGSEAGRGTLLGGGANSAFDVAMGGAAPWTRLQGVLGNAGTVSAPAPAGGGGDLPNPTAMPGSPAEAAMDPMNLRRKARR